MFAASVFNFVAQLYTLPEAYAKEVLDISAKFMLGPGQWFKGRRNPVPHPYFRARVDIGMKAVPRCIVSQVRTINYMSSRQCLLSAGSRVAILEKEIGDNLTLAEADRSMSAIGHSPFGHASRTQILIQNILDMRALPRERHDIKKIVYNAVFDHAHPKATLLHRFDTAYRTRWIKLGCLNDSRPRVLSERAISRLAWLSQHVPPRVHVANVRLHLNAWHTKRRYQQTNLTACYFCGRQVVDSLEHIFHCDLIRSLFPARWRGNLSKCFFLSGGQDEVLLASLLLYGIYAHHCAARHSSTPTHIESKASIARLIGELSVNKQVYQVWMEHLNFHYGR
jgi:hypothetical protein